jgi:26S proteasome regulatory subunit N2
VAVAVLSTTAKVKARERKKAVAEGDVMETVSMKVSLKSLSDVSQDDKPEAKKDIDVEMKSDESPSITKHGDISPINGSVFNLPDDGKSSTSAPKPMRKTEPSFEKLPNFSRVTPAQLSHISFPTEGRYQPVRTISMKPTLSVRNGKAAVLPTGSTSISPALGLTTERYAGGGGILILADQRPDEEAEFIEFEPPALVTPAQTEGITPNGDAISGRPTLHIALDEDAPEADPPESFEVCLFYWDEIFSDLSLTVPIR